LSEKKTVLTYEGLKNLEEELLELKTVKRKVVAGKIKEARGQGDLSENAEYDAAKEEQAEIEARIVVIEKMLRNAEVIDEEDINSDVISLGGRVTLYDQEFDETVQYTIVGSAEADPARGRISNESPLGMALIGRVKDEIIEVDAPDGIICYKVIGLNE
jgi:transcription elongation factor GreA